MASEVLEGERKARSGDQSGKLIRPGGPVAGRRQGPRREAQRTQAEPGSQTNGYSGRKYAEGQCNTAEGLEVAAPESQGQRTSVHWQGRPGGLR